MKHKAINKSNLLKQKTDEIDELEHIYNDLKTQYDQKVDENEALEKKQIIYEWVIVMKLVKQKNLSKYQMI